MYLNTYRYQVVLRIPKKEKDHIKKISFETRIIAMNQLLEAIKKIFNFAILSIFGQIREMLCSINP